MEYIDVLNEVGNPTGKKKSTEEIHSAGYWHWTVHVWIQNSKKELLIQKRGLNKTSHSSMWDISVAGHISAGENSIEAAMRETEEEMGISFDKEEFIFLETIISNSVLNDGTYLNNEFQDIYFVESDHAISDYKPQESEVSEIKFIPVQDLKKIISNNNPTFVPHPKEYEILFKKLSQKDWQTIIFL